MTKREAKYTSEGTKQEHCKICEHYRVPRQCSIVEGLISPQGWCKEFEPEKEAA